MSSELIHLLLDKTMARPEPRNRQTNPPNRRTKCKTVFVDSQRREAAGRTLTLSDKDSVLKIPLNGMQNLSIKTLYRRIFQLLEGSSLAFALKVQYLNNYKRYHHVKHTVGKVFSLRIQRRKVLRKTFSNA